MRFVNSCSYYVPKHIKEHVDYMTPGVTLWALRKRGHETRTFGITSGEFGHGIGTLPKRPFPNRKFPFNAAGDLSVCDKYITPACIRALYGVPQNPEYPNGTAPSDNSLGIFEEGDFYVQEDLDLFFGNFSHRIPKDTSPVPAFIDGAQAPVRTLDAGGESDLALELAYPLIYPQTNKLYQADDFYYTNSPDAPLHALFNTLLDAIDGVS